MFRKRIAVSLASVVIGASALTACGESRECLDWDTQYQWVNVPNGKGGTRLSWKPVTYCAEYAPEKESK
jgi:hypothetical protein